MAPNASLTGLTEELVHAVTGFSPEKDAKALKQCQDAALKNFRSHKHGRANQFAVKSLFEGIVEKCRVFDNDPVADALEQRLSDLGLEGKWTPELLSLLLILADRPAQKSRLEHLDRLRPPTPPPPLTWRDIVDNEACEDSSIWDNIDYAEDLSDDDSYTGAISEPETDVAPPSSSTSVDYTDPIAAQSLAVTVDESSLDGIDDSQTWQISAAEDVVKREIQVVCETLSMLQGLPSRLYAKQQASDKLAPDDRFLLWSCSTQAFVAAMQEAANVGTVIAQLRTFLSTEQTDPTLQRFTALCQQHLEVFDKHLSNIERRIADVRKPQIVSLLETLAETETFATPVLSLHEVVDQAIPIVRSGMHMLLDVLYERADAEQMTGNNDNALMLFEILTDCLEVYLRPIEAWMGDGTLPADPEHFCVASGVTDGGLHRFWLDRYKLNILQGAKQAPKFMHQYLADVLDTGKSMAFIREIGFTPPVLINNSGVLPPTPSLRTAIRASSTLVPFSHHLHEWLARWMQSKRQPMWAPVRRHLFDDLGLLDAIRAHEITYLSSDGSLFLNFADPLFSRLDASPYSWKDQVYTEELARATFGSHPSVDARRITISFGDPSSSNPLLNRSVHALSTLAVSYALPWPLANIVDPATHTTYQRALTHLLQLRRALRALSAARARGASATPASAPAPTALRHLLLHTLSTLHHHAAHALAAASAALHAALAAAASVPALRAAHAAFVRRVARVALLASDMRTARDAVVGLCDVAVLFGEAGAALADEAGVNLGRRRIERMKGLRGQVAQLRDVIVGELTRYGGGKGDDGERRGQDDGERRGQDDGERRGQDDGERRGQDDGEEWAALAEALKAGVRRRGKAALT